MTDPELARMQQERDEFLAEHAGSEDVGPPRQSPEEWAQQARDIEADLDEYPDERVDILCDAAEAWSQAGDLDQAERCYRLAAAEPSTSGGPDPRVYYASFLIDHGRDTARGHELFAEVWRDRPTEPSTYHFVAETLEWAEEYQSALTWANTGLSRCYPQLFSPEVDEVLQDQNLDMLLTTRLRVRRALQQPADSLDELSQRARERFREALDSFGQRHPVSRPSAVLYWPEAEYEQVLHQWPESQGDARSKPEAHTEHRRAVEGALRGSAEGNTPVVVGGDVAGFVEFCAEREREPTSGSARDDYAAWLAEQDRGIDWPPGRNEACWCGSGRKYKKCCGAPGFADTETPAEPG